MNETMNLQDAILKEVRREKVPVTLFLMNGFQLRGVITGFDSFVVVLVSDGKQHITVLQGKISCSRSCSAAPAREIRRACRVTDLTPLPGSADNAARVFVYREENSTMSIAENVAAIRAAMESAARDAGRDPKEIKLCAATKMNDAAAVRQAIAAGVDVCGENRVQELTQKLGEKAYVGAPVHFIGHLQTNKVRQVVGKVDLIQSVGSLHLLEAVNKEAARQNLRQDILLEVNIGEEAAKTGFAASEILPLIDKIDSFSNICVRGLMAIPPISENPGDNSKFFLKMREIYVDIRAKKKDNVLVDCLSMGMSGDYLDAIRCGSTMVRIGTAIFGERHY